MEWLEFMGMTPFVFPFNVPLSVPLRFPLSVLTVFPLELAFK